MSSSNMNRRDVLRTAGGTAALTAASYSRVLGANDRINVGMIGLGIRGQLVLTLYRKAPATNVAGVCDVYAERVDKAQQKAPSARGFSDYRKMLEWKELDAVNVSTPDHWHCPIAIEAMQAGKDVYVEKPLTLRIDEGPDVVKAARVSQRICQVGMQRRSSICYQEANAEYVQTGKLGKMVMLRTWYHKNPVHILDAPPELKVRPSNLDWALFLGQVKWRDWDPRQFWNFRAYLDFGGGQVTDLFTHLIDILHWYTGQEFPCAATAVGGVFSYKDGRTAPDTIHTALEYPGGYTASFDAALAAPESTWGQEFLGTNGRLVFEKNLSLFYPAERGAPPIVKKYDEDPAYAHVANFLDCMRSRKPPRVDVLTGHRSALAAHLCNLAYRRGEKIRFDASRQELVA